MSTPAPVVVSPAVKEETSSHATFSLTKLSHALTSLRMSSGIKEVIKTNKMMANEDLTIEHTEDSIGDLGEKVFELEAVTREVTRLLSQITSVSQRLEDSNQMLQRATES
jgi:hypothetical protein